MKSTNNPRRTHRKKVSALRLSSDTTATLPEYIATGGWQRAEPEVPSDLPPDYPDSAEEADEETDSEVDKTYAQQSPLTSPRKLRRFGSHRRRISIPTSSSDVLLDSLLERSVHALEMSNVLLQSSMSTQSSVSNIASSDSPPPSARNTSASSSSAGMDYRVNDSWARDLEEINRGVDNLLERPDSRRSSVREVSMSISSSLPATTSPLQTRRYRRRPSLDHLESSSRELRLEPVDRYHLISPPPRALTQYVASSDIDSIILPSTIGLRAPSSSHLHASPSVPILIDKLPEPSTKAYTMLSSFIRSSSSSSSSKSRRLSSSDWAGRHSSPSHTPRRSRSNTPKPVSPRRPMTPPIEESSSSSDSCHAKQTMSALRKILDELPPPPPPKPRQQPAFIPVSPPQPAEIATSHATASVSRLLTKSKHSSSTRPPSPPRHSSMKHQPSSATLDNTSRSTSVMGISDMFGAGLALALGGGSAPGSGVSTPKRISFAELPESYSSSSPKFKKRHKSSGKTRGKGSESDSPTGWWTWLIGPTTSSSYGIRQEDRGWVGRGATGFDEWAV